MKFSLKHILIAATLLSVYFALLFAMPHSLGAIILSALTTCAPSVAVGGIVYGRGYQRAFWMGSMGPAITAPFLGILFCVIMFDNYPDDDQAFAIKASLVGMHLAAVAGGLCAMLIRRLNGNRSPSWPCLE